MTERLSNTLNSYLGGAKQTVGETIGSTDLAASGAQQKAQADAAQKLADAKQHTEGTARKIQGELQQAVGSATNDPELKARGAGNEAIGEVQRNV
ncbi:hypothetical protein DFQ27_008177 [Actinomortierella ambigua]|uniref:CsbD family protein n=1 Tax=Actinomortierella ambigua TaxID=1343610 RepID=A0A9P6TYN8_9FUNG|nr:hypothetical protein DFQ27_008177 [Actinomortierella ambigua]